MSDKKIKKEILKEINVKCPLCKVKIQQYYHYSIINEDYYRVDKFKCECDWCISQFNRERIWIELSKQLS